LANFADRSVDCVIGIKEEVLASKLFNDLFPRHQLAPPLDEQEQDFDGDSFRFSVRPERRNWYTRRSSSKLIKSDQAFSQSSTPWKPETPRC
jgi:hypothetical protein